MNNELEKMIIMLFESKNKAYDGTKITAWVGMLDKYPIEKLRAAIKKCIYSSEDFPTVGKLVDDMEGVKISDAQVENGWNLIIAGRDEETPELREAYKLIGGYTVFGRTEYGVQQEMLKRRFCAAYRVCLEKAREKKLEPITNPIEIGSAQAEHTIRAIDILTKSIGVKL